MFQLLKFVLLFWIAAPFHNVEGYGRGAPSEACFNMEPQHGPGPQTSTPPFSVTPEKDNIETGGKLKVTIEPKGRGSFEGFLMMAVAAGDSATPKPIGRFINNPWEARSLDCSSGSQNAVTHRDAKRKNKLAFTWEAPSDFQGKVEFRCTFLQDFSNFWVQVPASTLVNVGTTSAATRNSGSELPMSRNPLVTIFDYFVWRLWFWADTVRPENK